ncbi:tetratricopeptide repeat protein [Streptomyces sp. TS71-3]|uniref:tetratricopeptide repeat protein n=1 Tax=Streptomyces sp. TS71-3 TaxID=2733862 RepID=UPI001B235EF0|nr:tetratricopeptide repeat protein [Streptomyces sp. TS71-3]GHJ37673.1 hypothetical protein Sm713_32820 [Streptomyces sp. TS71-3]
MTGHAAGHAVERAHALLAAGRPQQAAAVLAPHLAERPDDAAALTVLAYCHRDGGDLTGALEAADAALGADPRYAQAWVVRAGLLARLSRAAEAEHAAREVIRLLPDNWAGYRTLGYVLLKADDRGRRQETYRVALRAVELGPEEAGNHFLVGLAAHRLGDTPTAQRAYERALRLDPEDAATRYNLSLLHMRGSRLRPRRWARAVEGFADAAALDATDRSAPYNLQVMAWSVASGAGWAALAGLVVAVVGTAGARDGGPLLPAVPVTAAALAALGTGWALWNRSRTPPRLRRLLLTLARASGPVRTMAYAAVLVACYDVAAVALPRADALLMGAAGDVALWTLLITRWLSHRALRRRKPAAG